MIPIIFIIACFALFIVICNYFEKFDKEQQKKLDAKAMGRMAKRS